MPELPRLSQIAQSFAAPEEAFENMVSQMGLPPVPPGPMKTASMFLSQFEESMSLGEFPLPFSFPEFPNILPFSGQTQNFETGSEKSLGEAKTVEIKESPRKSRVDIEIYEA